MTDLTSIPTDGCIWRGSKDLQTCEIVGYALGERMTTERVSRALFGAELQRDASLFTLQQILLVKVFAFEKMLRQTLIEKTLTSNDHINPKQVYLFVDRPDSSNVL